MSECVLKTLWHVGVCVSALLRDRNMDSPVIDIWGDLYGERSSFESRARYLVETKSEQQELDAPL